MFTYTLPRSLVIATQPIPPLAGCLAETDAPLEAYTIASALLERGGFCLHIDPHQPLVTGGSHLKPVGVDQYPGLALQCLLNVKLYGLLLPSTLHYIGYGLWADGEWRWHNWLADGGRFVETVRPAPVRYWGRPALGGCP